MNKNKSIIWPLLLLGLTILYIFSFVSLYKRQEYLFGEIDRMMTPMPERFLDIPPAIDYGNVTVVVYGFDDVCYDPDIKYEQFRIVVNGTDKSGNIVQTIITNNNGGCISNENGIYMERLK